MIVDIPTEKYLIKYVAKKYPSKKIGNKKVVSLPRNIVYIGTHETNFLKTYHQRRACYQVVWYEIPSSTTMMQYAVIRYLKQSFFESAMYFIEAHVNAYQKVVFAIDRFYRKYDLSTDDYQIDSMRRKWNRYKKSQQEQEKIGYKMVQR